MLVVAGLGVIIASRAPRGGVLAALFGFWLLACVALFLIPGPVGENVTRLRSVVFPLMLLTVLVARFRPRGIAVLGLTLALAYNVMPYANAVSSRIDSRASDRAFWAPALHLPARPPRRRLPRRGRPDRRPLGGLVDPELRLPARPRLVPADGHRRERRPVPRPAVAGGVPPLAETHGRALRDAADAPARQEGRRPRGTAAGARRGWAPARLLDARLAHLGGRGRRARSCTGPAHVHLGAFKHDRIAMRFTEPGTYRLAVRYMPYWEVKRGAVCVGKAADGMTLLEVRRAGRLLLAAADGPSALVSSPLSDADDGCQLAVVARRDRCRSPADGRGGRTRPRGGRLGGRRLPRRRVHVVGGGEPAHGRGRRRLHAGAHGARRCDAAARLLRRRARPGPAARARRPGRWTRSTSSSRAAARTRSSESAPPRTPSRARSPGSRLRTAAYGEAAVGGADRAGRAARA